MGEERTRRGNTATSQTDPGCVKTLEAALVAQQRNRISTFCESFMRDRQFVRIILALEAWRFPRLHAAAARDLSRFVGRTSELDQLQQALGAGPRRARSSADVCAWQPANNLPSLALYSDLLYPPLTEFYSGATGRADRFNE